jgi:hypothetical protein
VARVTFVRSAPSFLLFLLFHLTLHAAHFLPAPRRVRLAGLVFLPLLSFKANEDLARFDLSTSGLVLPFVFFICAFAWWIHPLSTRLFIHHRRRMSHTECPQPSQRSSLFFLYSFFSFSLQIDDDKQTMKSAREGGRHRHSVVRNTSASCRCNLSNNLFLSPPSPLSSLHLTNKHTFPHKYTPMEVQDLALPSSLRSIPSRQKESVTPSYRT